MPTNFYCMIVQGETLNSLCVSHVYHMSGVITREYRSIRALDGVTLGLLLLTVYFDGTPSSSYQWLYSSPILLLLHRVDHAHLMPRNFRIPAAPTEGPRQALDRHTRHGI